MRKSYFALLATVAAAAIAGCGSSTKTNTESTSTSESAAATTRAAAASTAAASASSGPTLKIAAATVPGVGTVLVDSAGHTLYTFAPDGATKVTCTGSCAAVWPPVKLEGSEQPAPTGAVKASLLGSDPDPEGGRVVTYHGWPLYTYVADSAAGTATGQGINQSGGLWYVIGPSGVVVHTTH